MPFGLLLFCVTKKRKGIWGAKTADLKKKSQMKDCKGAGIQCCQLVRQNRGRQTWNLSKILHRRIFRLKILHRQFHQISTILVLSKNTKNE